MNMSEPGPHLRVWLKAGLVAPTVCGFFIKAGQMRNSILGANQLDGMQFVGG